MLSRGWVAAGDLNEGDEVYLIDGSTAFVTGAELERFTEPVTVYNLEVADLHTYFVGNASILVHNQYDDEDIYCKGGSNTSPNPGPNKGRATDFGLPEDAPLDTMVNKNMRPDDRYEFGGASSYGTAKALGNHFKNPQVFMYSDGSAGLPNGLGINKDAGGHYTIYPTEEMTLGHFQDLVNQMHWEDLGKLKDYLLKNIK